jgi:hypothetical protein
MMAAVLFPLHALAQTSAPDSSSVMGVSSSDMGSSASSAGMATSDPGVSSSAADSSSATASSAAPSSSVETSSSAEAPSSSAEVDAGPVPCVPGCHNNNHVVRFCVDGMTFNRTCAADETCRNAMCVLVVTPDAGPTCQAGCASSNVVRRCIAGEAQDSVCPMARLCQSGDCVVPPVEDAGSVAPVDGGCVNTCVDERTLRACSGGVTLTVTCNADSPCKAGACTPPEDTAKDGTCGCTGLSSLGMMVAAGMMVRRPRRRNV